MSERDQLALLTDGGCDASMHDRAYMALLASRVSIASTPDRALTAMMTNEPKDLEWLCELVDFAIRDRAKIDQLRDQHPSVHDILRQFKSPF